MALYRLNLILPMAAMMEEGQMLNLPMTTTTMGEAQMDVDDEGPLWL